MSDLYTAILNIRAVPPKDADINQNLAYKIGHDSARHAAAELALASDARIAELEKNAHIEISRQRSENIKLDMRIEELEQDNASLREQNTIVDAKCAELEAALREAREAMETCTPGDWSTGHVIHPSYDEKAIDSSCATIDKLLKD